MTNWIKNKLLCCVVLLMENKQLTPEAKYFLIRVLFEYGNTCVTLTTHEMVKKLGLSDVVIRKARDLLSRLGYLKLVNLKESVVGRPKIGLQLTDNLLTELQSLFESEVSQAWLNNIHPDHKLRLDMLIFWQTDFLRKQNVKKTKKPAGDDSRKHTMTAATRILLAVLYANADVCGAVRNISLVEISKLTVMSLDRLESQLTLIKEMGYLILRVSGLTNKQMFGHAKGSLFLNVYADNLMGSQSLSLVLLKTSVLNWYDQQQLAAKVYNWIRSLKTMDEPTRLNKAEYMAHVRSKPALSQDSLSEANALKDNVFKTNSLNDKENALVTIKNLLATEGLYHGFGRPKSIESLYSERVSEQIFDWLDLFLVFKLNDLFVGSFDKNFIIYLQSQIDHYASMLLSEYWASIDADKVNFQEDVLSKISLNLFPVKKPKKPKKPKKSKILKAPEALQVSKDPKVIEAKITQSAFSLILYCVSYQHAIVIKQWLRSGLRSTNAVMAVNQFVVIPTIHLPVQKVGIVLMVSVKWPTMIPERFCAIAVTMPKHQKSKIESYGINTSEVQCVSLFKEMGCDLNVLRQNMTL